MHAVVGLAQPAGGSGAVELRRANRLPTDKLTYRTANPAAMAEAGTDALLT